MAATATGPTHVSALPDDVRVLASDEEAIAAARDYADAIGPGAVERDRDRRMPFDELCQLAGTGLLGMRIPASFGGAGVSSRTVAEVFRIISRADPAIGQIPQNHIQFVDTFVRFGSPEQRALFFPEVLRGARFGNALSERGGRTARDWSTRLVRTADGGHRLNGVKYYSTGALTAQWIPVFAIDEDDEVVMAYVPRDAPGVVVDQDWNAFGQRGTFSGTTRLNDVEVDELWLVRHAFALEAPSTYGAFGQLMHAAVDVGIARAALDDGIVFLRERARPWRGADVERAADDPHIVRLVGELDVQVRAAEALLERSAVALDVADENAGDVEAVTAGRLEVAAAKAFAGDVALRVATEIFDVSGSSAADSGHGLDRHWRNARTHTLHDPARIKHLHLGRNLIDGIAPSAADPLV